MNAFRSEDTVHQPRAIRTLHWLTLLVLVLIITMVLAREGMENKGYRQWALAMHRDLGIFVWLLTWLRLWVRNRMPMANTQADTARWERLLVAGVHALLYLLLLAVPLLGWALSSARGQFVELPWIGALPGWPAKDLDLAENLETLHAGAAWALTALAGIHAAVALWHHRFLKDEVLLAMLPRRAPFANSRI
jgi:superoxide oxidase